MRASHRDHPGFSLIEVLVGIAIMSILVALTIPAVRAFRSHARSAECLAHLRDVGAITGTIVAENKELFPFWVANLPPSPEIGRLGMAEVYEGHSSTLEIFVCPADPAHRELDPNYTSYRYWPGEMIMDDLMDFLDTRRAIAEVSKRYQQADLASVFFDRGKWHGGKRGRNCSFCWDWHAAPLD